MLQVHLGKRARLLAGDWISFQPEAVQALVDGDSGTPTDTPDVLRAVAQRSPGSAAVKVQAVLTAPSAVNARCSMLRFSTELSSGAAGRTLGWTFVKDSRLAVCFCSFMIIYSLHSFLILYLLPVFIGMGLSRLTS